MAVAPYAVSRESLQFVWWGEVEYSEALVRMDQAQRDRRDGKIGDTMFLVEHPAVITYGRATPEDHLSTTPHTIPLHGVPRGGLATYHGPGQLVGYPIIALNNRAGGVEPDLHEYLRALEEGLIEYLEQKHGLAAIRVPGHTGVWVENSDKNSPPRKIASIGVSARRWISAHGFALNIAPDLAGFDSIVPCGIKDCVMTSVKKELGILQRTYDEEPMDQVAEEVYQYLVKALNSSGWCVKMENA